ncbi:MAG: PilZ domain-containing protein [Nitrospira sp.]|nr:PilZ domain-containing protein [Nitrospira sp.]
MQTIQQSDVIRDKARRYPRVRPVTPFGCSLSSLGSRWWFRKPVRDVGLVYDLSPHGVCVSTEASIKPGEQVSLTLRFTKGTPPAEVAVATVCWMNHPFYGLAFGRISESSLRQLTAYMNAPSMEDE